MISASLPPGEKAGPPLGAVVTSGGIRFSVWSSAAERIRLCLFDGERETHRLDMVREGQGVHALFVPGLKEGTRYGFRADGPYDPAAGLWFDPDKLLVDPRAVELDRPFVYDPVLAARRGEGRDTAPLIPKAVARALPEATPTRPALFCGGGLIYELPVRAFSIRHPEVAKRDQGTLRALASPPVIAHLRKLGVTAVELMPLAAWIDERHLPGLGLTNAWGYNPVGFMAIDPRLAPGGLADLRAAVAALHDAGIGVIMDVVFNHTGESDISGPTLSLRGLDARAYYRHDIHGKLVNDTGTGNTLACEREPARTLILDTLRHFVRHAGVDGFRFDLAPILGRDENGVFRPDASLFEDIHADPLLGDRVLIAEPWDIGPGGYQLAHFRPPFLEWNDRFRDDVRRFWRGDAGMLGVLATRLAGSSDLFGKDGATTTRTVNFIAAHDGMTLADLVSYSRKHNEANGEDDRDGHDHNFSWNNGAEGQTDDPGILARRHRDIRALLATLFASRGTVMLTAGDEFGRSQRGNNNAYAQDNDTTWLDWSNRDAALEDFVAALSLLRRSFPALSELVFLTGQGQASRAMPDVEWLAETGEPMGVADWENTSRRRLSLLLGQKAKQERLAVLINGEDIACRFVLPRRQGWRWVAALPAPFADDPHRAVPGRSVAFMIERHDS